MNIMAPEFRSQEECMRVDMPLVPQSLVESPGNIDKKELIPSSAEHGESPEGSKSFMPSKLGSGKTYSVSSLRAAVDYHAKFLTVAENNVQAARHPPKIPQLILDRMSGR
jgi:hypothetical protein